MEDTTKPKSDVQVLSAFFGKKPGESLQEFMGEFKALTDSDKRELAEGIRNGSLTY